MAAKTWARSIDGFTSVWLVHDVEARDRDDRGFVQAAQAHLEVHQPLTHQVGTIEQRGEQWRSLTSFWPPPLAWQGNASSELESMLWHVLRRWRILMAPPVVQHQTGSSACEWFGYFRADSYVDVAAVAGTLKREMRGSSADGIQHPLLFARSMAAHTHGVSLPMINWAGADLWAGWVSSGLLLNRAAVDVMRNETAYDEVLGTVPLSYIKHITEWLVSSDHRRALDNGLAGQREAEGGHVAMIEMAFVGSLRAQHRDLLLRGLPEQQLLFMSQGQYLQRFAIRLGAAAFGWSKNDLQLAGLGRSAGGHWPCRGLPPQCVLSFHAIEAPADMFALHGAVVGTSCVLSFRFNRDTDTGAEAHLRATRGSPDLQVWAAKGRLFVQLEGGTRPVEAFRSHQWCAALRGNRRIWASLIAGSRRLDKQALPHYRYQPSGRYFAVQERPHFLHDDEWSRSPAGKLLLRSEATIVLSLPNSGTTWFSSFMQQAQNSYAGGAAVYSDSFHPACNHALSVELSKVMGAPEDESWPHIFQRSSQVALDLLVELVTDRMHNTLIKELQHMREYGVTVTGGYVPEMLHWPWKGLMRRIEDPTRMRMMITKEIINVPHVLRYVELRQRAGLKPLFSVAALYRHRAHMFPLSSTRTYLCKECMFDKILESVETNLFPHDHVVAGLRHWWLRSALGAESKGIHRFVFAHLIIWYLLLRARPYGVMVVSYAELMLLGRDDLRRYLNKTFPATLRRNPGIAMATESCIASRYADPLQFLKRREQRYSDLGVESFAQAAIAEMKRLDPLADLSLLELHPASAREE